jgi:hypothetical protein
MFVTGRTPPRARSIPDAQVREIVKRVLADPRIQRAAAKLAKAPAPAPFRKLVSTTPSALPLAKLVRQRAAVAEALADIRKQVRDERAVQSDINARLDRVGQKLAGVVEVSRRISKVATGVEKIAQALKARGFGLPRGGSR